MREKALQEVREKASQEVKKMTLRQIYIDLRETDDAVQVQIDKMQNIGMQVTMWTDVKRTVLEKAANDFKEDVLVVTDCSRTAEELAAQGVPVLGVLTGQNQDTGFSGVKYLCEGTDSLETEYLERVYRRYKELPWNILETDRCLVRETTEEDVEAFYKIYAEPSVTAYMEDLFEDKDEELAYTRQYRKAVYEFCGFGIWTVLWKETGEVVGRIGLTLREGYDIPELGFLVGVPWQKKGVATEVCNAVLRFGEEELGFSMIQALVEPGNDVSLKLLKKLGFACEGECVYQEKTYWYFLKKL